MKEYGDFEQQYSAWVREKQREMSCVVDTFEPGAQIIQHYHGPQGLRWFALHDPGRTSHLYLPRAHSAGLLGGVAPPFVLAFIQAMAERCPDLPVQLQITPWIEGELTVNDLSLSSVHPVTPQVHARLYDAAVAVLLNLLGRDADEMPSVPQQD